MKINRYIAAVTLLVIVACGLHGCTKESLASGGNASSGKAGSLTKFTVAGSYLYAVDNHSLYAYSLQNASMPEKVYTSAMNFDIETIYAHDKYLFLGTRTGLYIYSIDTASSPRLVGAASHARACDPVVANDSVAFVTLKGMGSCGPAVSGLYVHDIKDITKPVLKTTIELPEPLGLGLQDSILYVSCAANGLKIFNVNNPYEPALISTKNDGDYLDVIAYSGVLICFVRDGILLYNINNPAVPELIRSITN